MGPCILTADETAFPPALDISCAVNGEERRRVTSSRGTGLAVEVTAKAAGEIVIDVSGEEKKKLTVPQLLELFSKVSAAGFSFLKASASYLAASFSWSR